MARLHVPDRHEVVAALRTASGRVYLGLHVEGSARRTSVCAEAMAIGAAFLDGERLLETCVAVHYKPAEHLRVLTPCGLCRELISDYAPD